MNGSAIAAATPTAPYDVRFGSHVALGLIIRLAPAGKKGPGVPLSAEPHSFTPLLETLRGLLAGPPSAGPIFMAIAVCAVLTLLGCLWVRARFAKRA